MNFNRQRRAFLGTLAGASGIHRHYCNYPALAYSVWATACYGAEGCRRQEKVKAQYDPDDLLRYAQSVRI